MADARQIADIAREEAANYRSNFGGPIPCAVCCCLVFEYNQLFILNFLRFFCSYFVCCFEMLYFVWEPHVCMGCIEFWSYIVGIGWSCVNVHAYLHPVQFCSTIRLQCCSKQLWWRWSTYACDRAFWCCLCEYVCFTGLVAMGLLISLKVLAYLIITLFLNVIVRQSQHE